MTYFYERNIVEIKNEYTTFLINIMTPYVYEGIKSVYNYALDTHKKFLEKARDNPQVKSPGPLKIFQTCLKEIPLLNNESIDRETKRIKEGSKCSDWFDDLVKAVIKSNIMLLTFSTNKDKSELIDSKYHEKINTKDFIHKCYIEVAKLIYNNPELYWHEFPILEVKRNQREIFELIKLAIQEGIRKMLPTKNILAEFLKKEYHAEEFDITGKISESKYTNIKNMINRDINGGMQKNNEEKEYNSRTLYNADEINEVEKNLLDDQQSVTVSESYISNSETSVSESEEDSNNLFIKKGSDDEKKAMQSVDERMVNPKLLSEQVKPELILEPPLKQSGGKRKYIDKILNEAKQELLEKNKINKSESQKRDEFFAKYMKK